MMKYRFFIATGILLAGMFPACSGDEEEQSASPGEVVRRNIDRIQKEQAAQNRVGGAKGTLAGRLITGDNPEGAYA